MSTLNTITSTRPAPAVPRAAIYCRVSSPGQQENGSLEEQVARCRAWCAEHGYAVVEPPYREVFSGEDVNRPQLDQLRDDVRAGRIEVVVADKVDRFSRADPAITAYVMVEAEQYGAKVEFVEVRDDSFEGQILSAVLSIVARVEHKRIKERTTAGKRRRVAGDPQKGKPPRLLPGNVPRYGWRYADAEKSCYVPEPAHAAIMERIYRELGEAGRSLKAICRDLDAEGVPPPTAALAQAGYAVGKRKASLRWNPSSVARMLKEPCYWGEAVAYRYEMRKREQRDPQTNRVRRVKTTRYRDTDSDQVVRYPADVWPGLVSKEVAQKALARLKQNRVEAERNLKHVGVSFLRAGLVTCGYCGANMVLHHHAARAGAAERLAFVCGRRRAFTSHRSEQDCPSGGQFSIRLKVVEGAVWDEVAGVLSDPQRVPAAYDALARQDADVRERQQRQMADLSTRVDKARLRRSRLAEALANADDPDVRQTLTDKMTTESAAIRGWEAERERAEAAAEAQRAESAEVHEAMQDVFERRMEFGRFSVADRRKLVKALGVRVAVYRHQHQPWFEMVADLPGFEASWHAQTVKEAATELLPPAAAASAIRRAKPSELRQLMAAPDRVPRLSEWMHRDAFNKWTAPVVSSPIPAEKTPASAAVQR